MSGLKQLEKRRDLLYKAVYAKKVARDTEIVGVVEEIKAKYAGELDELNRKHVAAAEAVDDEKIRLALERGGDAPWPAGTRLKRPWNVGDHWRPVFRDQFGVLEICTRDTVFSKVLSKYSKPEYGETFIREFKPNGNQGLAIQKVWGWPNGWTAVDPKAPKNPNYKDPEPLRV